VHLDHTIVVNKGMYTLPTRFVGARVLVESTRSLVRIYSGHELIRTRERVPAGGRCIDHGDYPKEKSAFTMRDPERLMREADEIGAATGSFMRALLAGPTPWVKIRQAQALLRLVSKYGAARVESACDRANAFDLRNTKRVEGILLQALPAGSGHERLAEPTEPATATAAPRFSRPNRSFRHDSNSSDGTT
jgi:hypothetical protein